MIYRKWDNAITTMDCLKSDDDFMDGLNPNYV